MNQTIDLTGKKFDEVYFDQSIFAFRVPKLLGSSLQVLVWGLTVPSTWEPISELAATLEHSSDEKGQFYLNDWATLTFSGVVGGQLTLSLREPSFEPKSAPFIEGKLERSWPRISELTSYSYEMNSWLDYPEGNMELDIWSTDGVQLKLKPSEFISLKTVLNNPYEYSYDRFRERQLQTLLKQSN